MIRKFMIELLCVDYFDNKFAFPQRGYIQNHMELLAIQCMILYLMPLSIFEGERNLIIGGGEVNRWVLHFFVCLCLETFHPPPNLLPVEKMHLISSYLAMFLSFDIVYIYVCMCVHNVCVSICAYNMYVHVYYVYIYVCVNICMYAMYIYCIYICLCVYVYTCVYVYVRLLL